MSGGSFFFCRAEDVGTENEKWSKMKLESLDNLSIQKSTQIPELDTDKFLHNERKWQSGFSFTASTTVSDEFVKFIRREDKRYRGRNYYYRRTMGKERKVFIKKLFTRWKKHMFRRLK